MGVVFVDFYAGMGWFLYDVVIDECAVKSVLGVKDEESGGILFPGHGIKSELPELSSKNST